MTSYLPSLFWQDRIKIKNKSHTKYSYIIINDFIIHLCNVCNKLSCTLLISKKQQFPCLINITTSTHPKEICSLILPYIAIIGVVKRDDICLFFLLYI